MGHSSADDFPLLSALGLYAADIRGDGNCLFNALSDQLYGTQDKHAEIRATVIDYMREHASYYKQFIDVHPGGGIRRNPKRKNAGAYSTPALYVPPSPADIDRVFESHLQSMSKGGTYGDNMEITAFASAYKVDVKIYQRDFAYIVTGGEPDAGRPVAHIAYHVWEHYSSIRNTDGPHTGKPEVHPRVLSPEEEEKQREKLAHTPVIQAWQVDTLSKSLPFLCEKPSIKRALEATKGNMDAAWEQLMRMEKDESTSSQPESSSVERDLDSDDEDSLGPNKKRDRRMSRVSRARQNGLSSHPRHGLSNFTTYSGSQESLPSQDSEASSVPVPSQQSNAAVLSEETRENEETKKVAESKPQSPDSIPIATTASPVKPPIRLRLHPPRSPASSPSSSGRTSQRQPGPRISARDRRDIKKQAQKAARKERQKAEAGIVADGQSAADAGLALRQKGMTNTPPVVETLRTLYI